MNKREWKPGDVGASVAFGYRGIFVGPYCSTHQRKGCWHNESGFADPADDNRRPLVVIDPEDRDQIERFVLSLEPGWGFCGYEADDEAPREPLPDVVDEFQRALREFVPPTPPKPDEPTGLGAVVEDTDSRLWVRVDMDEDFPWTSNHDDTATYFAWREISAVRALSDGVTTDA